MDLKNKHLDKFRSKYTSEEYFEGVCTVTSVIIKYSDSTAKEDVKIYKKYMEKERLGLINAFAYETSENNMEDYSALKGLIEHYAFSGDMANLVIKNLQVISEDVIRAKTFCCLMDKYAESYVECIEKTDVYDKHYTEIEKLCDLNDVMKIYDKLNDNEKKVIRCKAEFDYIWFSGIENKRKEVNKK